MTIKLDILPISGARIFDSWGNPRTGGGKHPHEGIDIMAPRGTPIFATVGGIVTQVGVNSLGGNRVGITDKYGNYHYYAHLNSPSPLQVGQTVKTAQIVGYVGNSGDAKGGPTHLHYGIYEGGSGGKAVNPYDYLSKLDKGSILDINPDIRGAKGSTGVPVTGDERIDSQYNTNEELNNKMFDFVSDKMEVAGTYIFLAVMLLVSLWFVFRPEGVSITKIATKGVM